MTSPTVPATKYVWAAAILTGSLATTSPLLFSNHAWAYCFINLVIAGVLSLQLLLLHLPHILQARGRMHLNIRKGDSLLLQASQHPAVASRKRTRRRTNRPR